MDIFRLPTIRGPEKRPVWRVRNHQNTDTVEYCFPRSLPRRNPCGALDPTYVSPRTNRTQTDVQKPVQIAPRLAWFLAKGRTRASRLEKRAADVDDTRTSVEQQPWS